MFVKINTKEHFSILGVTIPVLHANMAEELADEVLRAGTVPPRNIILDLGKVTQIDEPVAEAFGKVYEACVAGKTSFIITGLQAPLTEKLKRQGLNNTPTLSEAVDLVMMEQLEREL